MPKKVPVYVDNKFYATCYDAERILGLPKSGISHALKHGKTIYYGHTIQSVVKPQYKLDYKRKEVIDLPARKNHKCPVYCVTTGKVYQTIREVANELNVDEWTMSRKMEACGKFIDENGNEYNRLKPMYSKNIYNESSPEIGKKRENQEIEIPLITNPVVNVEPQKPEVPDIVKEAISEKIKTLLKESGIYNNIIELLKYGGFTTLDFKDEK